MKLLKHGITATLVLSILCTATTGCATKNMEPDYEVKYLLSSEMTLDDSGYLVDEVRDWFEMPAEYELQAVQFIDTDAQDFNEEGWLNRIRHKAGDSNFTITYKKRYAISDNDVTAALNKATKDGFDSKATGYEPQIDWGYNKMTLSFSNSEKISAASYDSLGLPDKESAVEMMQENIPSKLNNWKTDGWAQSSIAEARVYGPILSIIYTGQFEGTETVIEIWPITLRNGDLDNIVEVSFNAATYEEAEKLRTSLFSFLDEKGIVLYEDGLKAQIVMDNY